MQIIAKEESPAQIAADESRLAPALESTAEEPVEVKPVAVAVIAPDSDPAKTAALALEFGM